MQQTEVLTLQMHTERVHAFIVKLEQYSMHKL